MLKKISTKILALAIVFGSVFAPSVYAEPEAGIAPQISPVSYRVALRGGDAMEHRFVLSNKGNKEAVFTVYAEPYRIASEDYTMDFGKESKHSQLARWITFKQADGSFAPKATYNIAGGATQNIEYKISVPTDIPAGSQQGVIFAEAVPKDASLTGSGIQAVPRVSLLVYGRTEGDTKQESKLINYSIPRLVIGGAITVSSTIENLGNTDFDAEHHFAVKTLFGASLHESNISLPILPDSPARKTALEMPKTPFMGIYRVEYSVKTHGKTLVSRSKFVIVMPVFMFIIMIMLLTILVIWLILFIKQRKERRSRRLV